MDINRYEFANPYEGDWNNYEISVRENPSDKVLTFDTEHWVIEHRISLTRKPEPIKAGQGWWDDRFDFETQCVEVIGLIENNATTYVAYIDFEGNSHLSTEHYFRNSFHRNLSE